MTVFMRVILVLLEYFLRCCRFVAVLVLFVIDDLLLRSMQYCSCWLIGITVICCRTNGSTTAPVCGW